MLQVFLNKDIFKYDIHSLIKAFYPADDVVMTIADGTDVVNTDSDSEESLTVRIVFEEDQSGVEASKQQSSEEKQSENSITTASQGGTISVRITDHSTAPEMIYEETSRYHGTNKSRSLPDSNTDGSEESSLTPKNAVKQLLYKLLSQITGKELPWGTLTGIRPTTIPVRMIRGGSSDEEICQYLKNVYYTSDEKIDVSLEIAHRELDILKDVDFENGYSLYIGIPFCPTRCLYCSFTAYPIGQFAGIVDDYVDCLIKELDYVADNFKGKKLTTIYIGGGTPTTLLPYQMDKLFSHMEKVLDLSYVQEFTVESGRPDSIDVDKLRMMKKHGVSRISVNPQTMSDKTLKFIGRMHSVQQTIDAFKLARAEGFDNINMDIILGLPGETEADVQKTMDDIGELVPDDLTVHSLAIKRASRLAEWIRENGIEEINNTEEMMKIAEAGSRKMGLTPYYLYRQKNMSGNFENTGYAKPGKAGMYNILIMEELQSIVALGAGTVSKRVYTGAEAGRIERCDCVKDVKMYMDNIDDMIQRKKKLFN